MWVNKTSQENSSLGCVTSPAIFTGYCYFKLPFILFCAEHYFWTAVHSLCRNQKLVWWLDCFKIISLLSLQNSLVACQMDKWCNFLIEYTFNESFFHVEKKQVSFLYSKKGGVIQLIILDVIQLTEKSICQLFNLNTHNYLK